REISARHNPRCAVTCKGKQPTFVTGHQIIGFASFAQSQEKIIRGIGRPLYPRQLFYYLGKLLDFVDKAPRVVRLDAGGNRWLVERWPQLVELLCTSQKSEIPLAPDAINGGRISRLDQKSRHQNIGIEHHTHQALSAFLLPRRSARTSSVASLIMVC